MEETKPPWHNGVPLLPFSRVWPIREHLILTTCCPTALFSLVLTWKDRDHPYGQEEQTLMKPGKRQTEPTASATTPGTDPPREAPATAPEQHRWLPLTSAPPGEATDPTKAVEPGNAAATSYKRLSYALLHLEPGQQMLDVGCGSGGFAPPG